MRNNLFILLCTCLLVALAACSSDPLAPAREAVEAGDRTAAIEAYSSALSEDLDDTQRATALYERGYQYADKLIQLDDSDNDKARDDMFAAVDLINSAELELEFSPVGGLELLATNYNNNENYDGVIAVADKGLTLDASNARLLNLRGGAHLEQRNFDQAIADLKASLQGEVDAASAEANGFLGLYDAYFRLGRAMLDIGDYEEAASSFTEAYDAAFSNENKANALAERGFVYGEMYEVDLSLADLDQAISLNPDLAIAYAYRSYAYSAQENYELAIADANNAVELGDSLDAGTRSAILHSRAYANSQVGEYAAAIDDATASIELAGVMDPSAARTYGIRSTVHRNRGDYEAAIADATTAIEIGSSDITALDGFYYRRAQANYLSGSYAAALEDVEAALELGEETAARYELQGDIYDQLGDIDAAISSYQQAIALAPDSPWLHNYLGDIYYNAEDYVGAEGEYRAAIRINDQVNRFHSNLGYALREQERYDEAIEAYTVALAISPDSAWDWYARGISYYYNFDDASAIADLEMAIQVGADDDAVVERANEILSELR